MPSNLEQQLGELTGQLKGLVPALEKVEERQNASDKLAAGEQARHDALRREFDDFRNKASNRMGELYKKTENLAKEDGEIRGEIKPLADGAMVVISEEAFTPAAHGTQLAFFTTPLGTVALTARYVMDAGGDLIMLGADAIRHQVDASGSVGTAVFRWGLVRAVTITAGDYRFENGWRVMENWLKGGLVFKDAGDEEMLAIRPDGLYVRGRKVA